MYCTRPMLAIDVVYDGIKYPLNCRNFKHPLIGGLACPIFSGSYSQRTQNEGTKLGSVTKKFSMGLKLD